MPEPAITVERVSKVYPLNDSPAERLRRIFGFPGTDRNFHALREVSFHIAKGEAFGVVGQNGSGKSTLLQIMAGILRPTTGTVVRDGRLSALLELGSGFNPEFTGRDNVYLNASILGLSRAEIDSRFAEIETFAEIGSFIDQPLKTYSTGMVLRLAFAVSVHVEPEILVVDEALAVGDITFRQRCLRRIHELRSRGLTLVFVSHEASDIRALCDRALWLDHGVPQAMGPADEVVAQYLAALVQKNKADLRETGKAPAPDLPEEVRHAPEVVRSNGGTHRYGDGRAQILGAAVTHPSGEPMTEIRAGEPLVVRVSVAALQEVPAPIVGFLMQDSKGVILFGTNTARENYPLPFMQPGDIHTVDFHWTPLQFAEGTYTISAGISSGTREKYEVCDHIESILTLSVPTEGPAVRGYLRLPCHGVTVHYSPGEL